MQSPGLERAARLIAENVASAVEREQETTSLHPLIREALIVELLRHLLMVMPTPSGAVLVDACNRCLNHAVGIQLLVPRVESVDVEDGSVTIQPE